MTTKEIRTALASIAASALRGNDLEATRLERRLHNRLTMERAPADLRELANRSYAIMFYRAMPRVQRGAMRS